MRKALSILLLLLSTTYGYTQVAINEDASDPDNSAMLDIKSTSMGLLIPRMNFAQMYNIERPAKGLLIFNTSANVFYYYDGKQWCDIAAHLNHPSVKKINIKETIHISPSTRPMQPKKGDLYMDNGTNMLRCWNGREWKDLW